MYLQSNITNTSPHIYQLAEQAYRHMTTDGDSQAVIISGESGAGKTESAKLILNYISAASGNSQDTMRVKDIILSTNPLLESFGNAKTVRNDNSSRFGKYLEILFTDKGDPCGGLITNFLLEKTRVAFQARGERCFHIFYQMVMGANADMKQTFAIEGGFSAFNYLSQSGVTTIEDVDDAKEFQEVLNAMQTVEISQEDQWFCFQALSGILHLGNIQFQGEAPAQVVNASELEWASYLLELEPSQLEHALVHRTITSGSARHTVMNVPQNYHQAAGIRDALAKTLYERIFDWLVQCINRVLTRGGRMPMNDTGGGNSVRGRGGPSRGGPAPRGGGGRGGPMSRGGGGPVSRGRGGPAPRGPLGALADGGNFGSGGARSIGVLDIYGFEIFQVNGFEQFCINYVNERIQQVFIDLTLRQEQREYQDEGMKWKDIRYFDNQVVCDLIEGGNPPGLFRLLDDTCKSVHSLDSAKCDAKFMEKAEQALSFHQHLVLHGNMIQFTVKHYAGDVTYDVNEFCFKNYDNLYTSIVMCMQSSRNDFYRRMFPEDVTNDKQSPTTSGMKIRQSANLLMKKLSVCTPHYIRCIKPNSKKQPMTFTSDLVEHQVKYLGLLENVKVKSAGYAYRHYYHVFLKRFGSLMDIPPSGGDQDGCRQLVQFICNKNRNINAEEFGFGKTKIFVKTPETIWTLEEMLEQKLDPEG